MTIFEYVIAAIMIVLGLGVTQLLGDLVDAFRRRQTYRLHWIPIAWAIIIFAWQMQFLWAVFELQDLRHVWSATHFTMMLVLALLLFVAGSLVVPKATDETKGAMAQFRQDGRWSLAVLAVFFVLAYFTNVVLFGLHYADFQNLEDLIVAGLLVAILFAKKEKTWGIATIVFAIVSAFVIVDLSPTVYEMDESK